jgi:hypothetical protein
VTNVLKIWLNIALLNIERLESAWSLDLLSCFMNGVQEHKYSHLLVHATTPTLPAPPLATLPAQPPALRTVQPIHSDASPGPTTSTALAAAAQDTRVEPVSLKRNR